MFVCMWGGDLMIIEPGTKQVTPGHIFSLSLDPKYRVLLGFRISMLLHASICM